MKGKVEEVKGRCLVDFNLPSTKYMIAVTPLPIKKGSNGATIAVRAQRSRPQLSIEHACACGSGLGLLAQLPSSITAPWLANTVHRFAAANAISQRDTFRQPPKAGTVTPPGHL